MNRKIIFRTALLALIVGLVNAVWFFVTGEAVPKDKLKQVIPGMTKANVNALLGAPLNIRHDTPSDATWFYGGISHFKYCTVEVKFGADGRVTGKFHDH